MIDEKLIKDHGLTLEEYGVIVGLIGRDPNLTELGIFSVMWSEHCGYKSSRVYLKGLPTKGKHVIQGPGENAGILDIGDGLAVVFKIESHNHPSFIEPYQGAATGVGGILRDIFTMGARPIAVMDSLRFGPLDDPLNRSVMEGVVSGIAGYGNSIGIPTVGGEIQFDAGYTLNPLVNVFALGLVEKDRIFYAKAEGAGNPVLYVGAKTGRDGIHGATMASAEFGKDTEHKRPNVQVGDPFKEKLLLEACLEVMATDMIVGIQDMGAAGLTCSTTEMAAKAGTGMDVDLDLVPQREEGMTPYEILLSESQERMLICAKKDRVKEVQAIFAKWDLDAVVNLCPAYRRPVKTPAFLRTIAKLPELPVPEDLNEVFFEVISSPSIADKEWVFRQYDHMIQINTAFLPGADAAVLRIKGSRRALAMTLDGNSLYTYLDPRSGGKIAVAEACRNLACVGARPIGVTNCLNFGNPEKPEVMWQFKEAVAGMSEACKAFEIPVTGGNVSFYNDTEGASIHPTPVLGVVGLIEDVNKVVRPGFRSNGDVVILLGENRDELGGSEYLKVRFGLQQGAPPAIDLARERAVHELCLEAAGLGLLRSAHDVSDGGLAVCLAESAFLGVRKPGCSIDLGDRIRPDALLFGETQSRIVVTVSPRRGAGLLALAKKRKVRATRIGRVGGSDFVVRVRRREVLRIPVAAAFKAWKESVPARYKVKG